MKIRSLLLPLICLWAAIASAETVGTPSSLSVPASDLDGRYSVRWLASSSQGAVYILEEATDADFTTDVLTVYNGKNTKVNLKGRFAGKTYYYRLKATLQGFDDSDWILAENGCAVPYVVATKDNSGGTIAPLGPVTIPVGEEQTITVTPNEGFHIVKILVDGNLLIDASAETVAPYSYATAYHVNVPAKLVANPRNKHAIKAKFKINRYQVTSGSNGSGGRITPLGTKIFKHGKNATYTIVPDKGQKIASVLVNGVPQKDLPSSGAYKLTLAITGATAIEATFASIPPPGDAAKYFPFEQGNAWNYRGTIVEDELPPVNYTNGLLIAGTKVIEGRIATIFTETNPENSGYAIENYREIEPDRVTYLGNNDPDDLVVNEIVPYEELKYPLLPNAKLVQVDNQSIVYRDDLDGDGKFETARVYSEATVLGNGPVTGELGDYDDCIGIREKVTVTLKLSQTGSSYKVTGTQDSWFCSGIGLARRTSKISSADFLQTGTEELIGYRVGAQQKGILPEFHIVDDIAPANSDTQSPGRPAVASDGTNFLVVSQQVIDPWTSHNIGLMLAPNGEVLRRFDINTPQSYSLKGSSRPAVAFDGTNYLVVHDHDGKIHGQRVSTAGNILDGPEGFTISTDNPSGATNHNAAVAFDGNNYLVVWGKFDPTYVCENSLCASKGYDIYGARVTPGGLVLDEFPVCTAAGGQVDPAVAFDGVNYFVVWNDPRNATGPLWDNSDIYGSRVTTDGLVLDPEGIPVATAAAAEYSPQLLFDGTTYFVVWETFRATAGDYRSDIYGARISGAGVSLDGPPATGGLAINTAPFTKGNPTTTFDGQNYLVAWPVGAYPSFPPAGIYLVRVAPDGTLIDGPADKLGIAIGAPPPLSKFAYPVLHYNGVSSLLAWENNSETATTSKDIRGVFISP